MSGDGLLRATLRTHRWRTTAAAALLGAHQVFEALVPVVVGATIDGAVEGSDTAALLGWLAALAVLFVLLSGAFRNGARVMVATSEDAAHELRMRLAERVLDPRGGGEGGRVPGELLSIATADVDAAAGIVRAVAVGVGVAVALAAGARRARAHVAAAGAARPRRPAGGAVARAAPGAPARAPGRAQQERAAGAAGVAADLVEGLRVLQGIGGVGAGIARYREASRSSLEATMGASRAEAAFDASAVLVAGLALAAVALVGGRQAAQGDISIGELIAAVGVTQFLVGPLSRLAWVGALLARSRASGGRVAAALAAPPAVAAPDEPAAPVEPHAAALTVRGLRHGPLDGLDLEVEGGALHGVVVPDPAAAAALLDCLGSEAVPEAGSIAVAGTPLRALDPATARRTIVVSPHDAVLLSETVPDNVAAAAPGDDDAVARAIAAAAVEDVLDALPEGAATRLDEGGRSLSGGQRQRIALARALAAPAPVLVLHEPTTALDAATEARVAGALREVRRGRTTLLVTTSPVLLAACDAVTVVHAGAAAGSGAHAALLEADPAYREAVLA